MVKVAEEVEHFNSGLIMESTYSSQVKGEKDVHEECNKQKLFFSFHTTDIQTIKPQQDEFLNAWSIWRPQKERND